MWGDISCDSRQYFFDCSNFYFSLERYFCKKFESRMNSVEHFNLFVYVHESIISNWEWFNSPKITGYKINFVRRFQKENGKKGGGRSNIKHYTHHRFKCAFIGFSHLIVIVGPCFRQTAISNAESQFVFKAKMYGN